MSHGGGGHGDPLKRDPERVRADVALAYLTPKQARARYEESLRLFPDERVLNNLGSVHFDLGDYDLSRFRLMTSGGAIFTAELKHSGRRN